MSESTEREYARYAERVRAGEREAAIRGAYERHKNFLMYVRKFLAYVPSRVFKSYVDMYETIGVGYPREKMEQMSEELVRLGVMREVGPQEYVLTGKDMPTLVIPGVEPAERLSNRAKVLLRSVMTELLAKNFEGWPTGTDLRHVVAARADELMDQEETAIQQELIGIVSEDIEREMGEIALELLYPAVAAVRSSAAERSIDTMPGYEEFASRWEE